MLLLTVLLLSLSAACDPPVDAMCERELPLPAQSTAMYQRVLFAALNTQKIGNNPGAVFDANHTRARSSGHLSECQITAGDARALAWFQSQFGWPLVGPDSLGRYHLPGNPNITAFPYANVIGWLPVVVIDTAYPSRQDGNHTWYDYGLLIFTRGEGIFPGGVMSGIKYSAKTLIWNDWFLIVRKNATLPGGRVIPSCISEVMVSRSTEPSVETYNTRGDAEHFLKSQIVADNGDIGYYNDFLAIPYGDKGIWQGSGAKWETSHLMITFENYTRN